MQLETRRMLFLKMSSQTGMHELVFEIQKRHDWQNTPFKSDKIIVYCTKQKVEKSSKLGKIVYFIGGIWVICAANVQKE